MTTKTYRYYVRSPDGRAMFGFDSDAVARAVAIESGHGAAVVDTLAQAYVPIVEEVRIVDGKSALMIAPIGGWDTGKFGVDRDLIEAVKRGRVEIVHAFLAKGASANACDSKGGSALHWAASRGDENVVQLLLSHGADINATDASGRDALAVAEGRGKSAVVALLRGRGAR
jgi:Ankyrin repeats (3 copies)